MLYFLSEIVQVNFWEMNGAFLHLDLYWSFNFVYSYYIIMIKISSFEQNIL